MDRFTGTAFVALTLLMVGASATHAQANDSTAKFSLFGGTPGYGAQTRKISEMDYGGSADFRLPGFPLPLRASLGFRRVENGFTLTPIRFGTFSLDAIGRPVRRIGGVQPYLLGGLGLATQSDFVVLTRTNPYFQPTSAIVREIPRNTWAFAEVGVGLELGRHLFVQSKVMAPVASQGPLQVPVSIGFRFWD